MRVPRFSRITAGISRQGWYEVNFQAVAGANVAGGTLTFEVVYINPDYGTVGSIYPVTCNMSFAGNTCNWSVPILAANASNIQVQTLTTILPSISSTLCLVGK